MSAAISAAQGWDVRHERAGGRRAAGLWKLLSRIFPENRASLKLMAWSGFNEIGVHEKHGKLDGVWRDCVIVERLIPENLI